MRGEVCRFALDKAVTKIASHYPAADAAAVVSTPLAALTKERHVITQIDVSYRGTATPAAAGVIVTVNGVTVYSHKLPLANDTYQLFFPDGIPSEKNQAVVVTATDPGEASTTAELTVFYK